MIDLERGLGTRAEYVDAGLGGGAKISVASPLSLSSSSSRSPLECCLLR